MAKSSDRSSVAGMLRRVFTDAAFHVFSKRPVQPLSLHESCLWMCVGGTMLETLLLFHQSAKSGVGQAERSGGAELRGDGGEARNNTRFVETKLKL